MFIKWIRVTDKLTVKRGFQVGDIKFLIMDNIKTRVQIGIEAPKDVKIKVITEKVESPPSQIPKPLK